MAHGIDKPAGALQSAEPLDLDRSMADDGEKLLVRPHIGFERRDIEIADRDHRAPVAATAAAIAAPRSAANQAVSSSRNCSLCANFGLACGSGTSPPAGT